MASPSSRLGVCNLATPLISETCKATHFKFWGYIYMAIPNRSPLKFFGENGAWAYRRAVQIFWVPPIIPGTGKALDFKFGEYIYRAYPNKSPLKFRRKGRVCVSRDCPNFLGTPIISGTGKATDFKFCRNIHRVDRNKSP